MHEQQTAALVQHRPGTSAFLLKDSLGQPGKGEHFRTGGDRVSPDRTQTPLSDVGILLRYDDQAAPPGHTLRRRTQHGLADLILISAQQQLEHRTAPFLFWNNCIYHTIKSVPKDGLCIEYFAAGKISRQTFFINLLTSRKNGAILQHNKPLRKRSSSPDHRAKRAVKGVSAAPAGG